MIESNSAYNDKETMMLVKEIYKENKKIPSVTLHSFFTKESYEYLLDSVRNSRRELTQNLLHHRYKICQTNNELSIFLNNKNFAKMFHKITGRKIKKMNFQTLALTWKDYMLLNDKYREKPGIDIIIDLTDNWDYKSGGAMVYVDGTGDYFPVISQGNSLTIIQRNPTVHRFIKYLNSNAKNKERVIILGNSV